MTPEPFSDGIPRERDAQPLSKQRGTFERLAAEDES
jgi:hypothetical protein